ncbi:hypothetical protein [Myxacorys almedinensis]|uniref:Uncharacterized protein n=1 Tax=Myxacorys almedinensis A TaxID=2690445 RepID=A0A8J7Z4H9_9CYAN|nr:hypothetical protein [Myxacorys almedinensis]NDJ19629.1 hypothetical protein [Myxacorys almedinensis A]
MSNDSSIVKVVSRRMAGDRIRNIADRLKQETALQIKATSRILGAAAQISENHDRLINEVVEMVEEDFEQHPPAKGINVLTIEQLKHRFGTLNQAKAHFATKANSWASLVEKLNEPTATPPSHQDEAAVDARLAAIESDLKTLRTDLNQALSLLDLILKKVS